MRDLVWYILEYAMDNGYDLLAMSDEDIARELQTCCADFDGVPASSIIGHVEAWRVRVVTARVGDTD